MYLDIDVACKCSNCNKKFGTEDLYFLCDACWELRYTMEYFQEALEYASDKKYIWDSCDEDNLSYKDSHELREVFFRGVKKGYCDALFWMADYFGEVEFFEKKIEDKFYPNGKE